MNHTLAKTAEAADLVTAPAGADEPVAPSKLAMAPADSAMFAKCAALSAYKV